MTPTSASCSASSGFGDEAGRMRPDRDAGEQVADDRRQAEPVRDVAEDERRAESAGQREDESELFHAHLMVSRRYDGGVATKET